MFKDKLIKNIFSTFTDYNFFRKNDSNVIILSEKEMPSNIFEDISKVVEAGLRSEVFNYKGELVLEVQLLADIFNQNQISIKKFRKYAIIVIRDSIR